MKARIKGTNTIVECIETGKLINGDKGILCRHSDGALEVIPGDCLIELDNDFDWQSFRVEAAKDFVAALISVIDYEHNSDENIVKNAINLSEELIKQLKEKEEK